MSGIWSRVRDGVHAAKEAAQEAATVTTLRVAVTGLSRSGKTVFLVSLISNLLAMGRNGPDGRHNTLPELAKILRADDGTSRLLSVEIEPTGTQAIPRFPYEAYRDGITDGSAPTWPPFTDRPAFITLRLRLAPKSKFERFRSTLLGAQEVRLELLDYPGEWLVDLPLLEQSYEVWSAETIGLLHRAERNSFAGPFLQFLAALNRGAVADEKLATHGFSLYRQVLKQCREEAGLRWLQPGRFLMPGPWGEVPMMHFFPWSGAPEPPRGSLGALLRDRFDAYKKDISETFFKPYFSSFDRQIVLVDLLGAIWAGKAAFDDTQHAVSAIGSTYRRLLEGGVLSRHKITHVAFAATKSDHVDDLQRNNLKHLLNHVVMADAPPGPRPARISFHQMCAVRCTEDAEAIPVDGEAVDADRPVRRVVMGTRLGEDVRRAFSPGVIPSGAIQDSYWDSPYLVLPILRPPELKAGGAHPIVHINMDEVLATVLEGAL
jgi:predicted YcjX-like family ATPase